MLEVERPRFLYFWKTEIVTCIVARIEENLKGFRRDVQHKKCSLACLVWSCKFSELLAKEKNENMLENFSLTRMHLEKYDRTFHAHISYAYRKRKLKNSRLICVELYRTQRDESWARTGATDELSTLAL